jgi:cation:H+ antiporter
MAEGVAGLTLVGIGTSAPLIASSVQGARRGEHELVVGNVLGGNLFIALAGGGLVGLLANGRPGTSGAVSLWFMVGVVALSWLVMAKRGAVSRWEALILLVAYLGLLPFVSG